jgi:hypothetical protein
VVLLQIRGRRDRRAADGAVDEQDGVAAGLATTRWIREEESTRLCKVTNAVATPGGSSTGFTNLVFMRTLPLNLRNQGLLHYIKSRSCEGSNPEEGAPHERRPLRGDNAPEQSGNFDYWHSALTTHSDAIGRWAAIHMQVRTGAKDLSINMYMLTGHASRSNVNFMMRYGSG